jgi:protein ImuB
VDRLACADVPALALQLLTRRHPDWRGHPAAVVAADTPQGEILEVNPRARRAGILPGLRYAAALALCPQLRAGAVSGTGIDEGVDQIAERLARLAPGVEPCADEPGVFWLDASGLERLYRTPKRLADAVRDDLARIGFQVTLAIGFSRFCTYALARSGGETIILRTPEEERHACRQVPLARLSLPPAVRDDLRKLGVTRVGELLALPPTGLLERFGNETRRLHEMASGDLWHPLQPRAPAEPIAALAQLDEPDDNAERLTFLIKRMLPALLGRLAGQGQALAELEIGLALDHKKADRRERLKPAAPTLDERQIIDLARLRIEALRLAAGVNEIELVAHAVPATIGQLELFASGRRRDLAAGDRALARLRAELGEGAVVRARLTEGHLPEARFVWEPLTHLAFPEVSRPGEGEAPLQAFGTPPPAAASHSKPAGKLDPHPPGGDSPPRIGGPGGPAQLEPSKKPRTLVRRIFRKPIPLHTRPFRGPGGLHLRGMGHEAVIRVTGPYVVSGGWWQREIAREYHFAETKDGQILWVYYDRRRRRWFVQGTVE